MQSRAAQTPAAIRVVRRRGDPPGIGPLVLDGLERRGIRIDELTVPDRGLPRGRETRRIGKAFTATPAPLIESWRVARHVEALTRPGDTVLFSDRGGIGGIYSLEQLCRPEPERRQTMVWAGDGLALENLAVTGTLGGLPEEVDHQIDWELVSYRFSGAVLATGDRTVELLAGLGIAASVVTLPGQAIDGPPAEGTSRILVPEPVSRLAQTPAILRALSGLAGRIADLQITVAPEDEPDGLWLGTTWDTVAGPRDVLGEAVNRGHTAQSDVVVLGDPFHAPPLAAVEARRQGARALVAADSAAAVVWPEAETWQDEDDLAGRLAADPGPVVRRQPDSVVWPTWPAGDDSRARRVSVGIPIFRNVAHLDECVASVVSQQQVPHEILLIDDGSDSGEVDAAIARWQARWPDLISVLRQPNRGVCVARNRALESMTGDTFLFVDADDTLAPEFISECAGLLRADLSLWAAATWTEFFGEYAGIEAKPPFDARVGIRENTIISTCALVDMRVRDEGIRFAPDLAFLFCEDWDVWSQVVVAGGRFGLVPRPLARHRVHQASGGFRRSPLASTVGQARATARLHRTWPTTEGR